MIRYISESIQVEAQTQDFPFKPAHFEVYHTAAAPGYWLADTRIEAQAAAAAAAMLFDTDHDGGPHVGNGVSIFDAYNGEPVTVETAAELIESVKLRIVKPVESLESGTSMKTGVSIELVKFDTGEFQIQVNTRDDKDKAYHLLHQIEPLIMADESA